MILQNEKEGQSGMHSEHDERREGLLDSLGQKAQHFTKENGSCLAASRKGLSTFVRDHWPEKHEKPQVYCWLLTGTSKWPSAI